MLAQEQVECCMQECPTEQIQDQVTGDHSYELVSRMGLQKFVNSTFKKVCKTQTTMGKVMCTFFFFFFKEWESRDPSRFFLDFQFWKLNKPTTLTTTPLTELKAQTCRVRTEDDHLSFAKQ